MTITTADIEAMHHHLDRNITDHTARGILADALDDAGVHDLAAGYRALSVLRLHPMPIGRKNGIWDGSVRTENSWIVYYKIAKGFPALTFGIPSDWMESATGDAEKSWVSNSNFKWPKRFKRRDVRRTYGWTSDRRALDDLVAWAFSKLPADRKEAILRGGL
jgi:hypothetical protein